MAGRTVVGIFESVPAAERVKARLLEAGLREQEIVLSVEVSRDDIAAEAPGQTFSNQSGQPADDSASHQADAVHGGACVLTVHIRSQSDGKRIEALMRQRGARSTHMP